MRDDSCVQACGRFCQILVLALSVFGAVTLPSVKVSAQVEGASDWRSTNSSGQPSSIVWANCSGEVADEAKRILVETRNLADRLVLSRFDVIDVEIFALDAQRCANQLSKRDYCNQKRTLLEEFTRLLGELMASGSGRYLPSRRDWVRWSAELSTICGG